MIETAPQPELDSEAAELRTFLQELRQQLAQVSERVAALEKLASPAAPQSETSAAPVAAEPKPKSSIAVEPGVSEEEVLAISAAIAAWLGVHAHIRQIRLIRSGAWAQQGRASIQASHGLNR